MIMSTNSDGGRSRWGGFEQPAAIALVAGGALAASYAVAVQRPVPGWELTLTEWINGAPDAVATVLYPVMQLGTLAGPAIVAVAIAVFRRDWLLSGATFLAGLTAWFAAKGVKRAVERDRPLGYIAGDHRSRRRRQRLGFRVGPQRRGCHRSDDGDGSVAATVADRSRRVGRPRRHARVVHGVHLPADIDRWMGARRPHRARGARHRRRRPATDRHSGRLVEQRRDCRHRSHGDPSGLADHVRPARSGSPWAVR